MLKKIILTVFLALAFMVSAYSFEIGDFDFKNSFGLYSNDIGSAYRLGYFGDWRYKHLFFIKTIIRADYTSDLDDTTFWLFKPDFGVYVYKNIALRYQYEQKRFHTPKRIWTTNEDRIGISIDTKNTFDLLDKKLFWINDITIFPYEQESDQQIRWVTVLNYGKLSLLNVLFVDFDHSTNGVGGLDLSHFNLTTLSYSLRKSKYTDVSLRFQLQSKKGKTDVFRIGLGVKF